MDLALEEQLRKKGMLGDDTSVSAPEAPIPVLKPDPIAPTGIEGALPLKGKT